MALKAMIYRAVLLGFFALTAFGQKSFGDTPSRMNFGADGWNSQNQESAYFPNHMVWKTAISNIDCEGGSGPECDERELSLPASYTVAINAPMANGCNFVSNVALIAPRFVLTAAQNFLKPDNSGYIFANGQNTTVDNPDEVVVLSKDALSYEGKSVEVWVDACQRAFEVRGFFWPP